MPPVPLPSSPLSLLLGPLLPGILVLGWFAARFATRTRLLATFLAPGFALSFWLYGAHLVGYAARSFTAALWVTTSVLGLAGYALAVRRRPNKRVLARLRRLRDVRHMVLWSLVATALITPVALGAAFHDEVGVHGHLALASSIQNGYPPADIGFPTFDTRYHYGYDLVCAMLGSILRLDVSVAGDILTIACWFYVWVLAWTIGRRVAGAWGGPIAALVLVYGSGLPFFCPDQVKSSALGAQLCGFCSFGGTLRNSPIVSYHFQHPWTVGLPIALTLLIVFDRAPRARARWLAIFWLTACLAMSQFVLFASLAAALPVAEIFREKTPRLRSAAPTALAVGAAVLLASRTGGFFTPWPSGVGLELHAGIASSFGGSLEWMARVFGLLLLGGVVGHFSMRRSHIVYALLALGGLAVINITRYKYTGDIAKFATVATVGLAIPSAAWCARALQRRGVAAKALGAVALGALTISGLGHHAALLFRMDGVPAMYRRQPPSITEDDARAAAWLRENMPRRSVMFRNQQGYIGYATWAGLPQAYFDERHMSGTPIDRARAALLEKQPRGANAYLEQRVRFFVLEAKDRQMTANADAWIAEGLAVERAAFGRLRIVELLERPASPNRGGSG